MADDAMVIEFDSGPSSPLSSASTALSPPPNRGPALPINANGQTRPSKSSKLKNPSSASSSKSKPSVKKDRPIKPKPSGNGLASSSKAVAGSPSATPKAKKVKEDKDKKSEKQVRKAPKAVEKPHVPAPPVPPYYKRPEELEEYDASQAIVGDWQVTYVWAFLDRFKYSIAGLYSMEDLEIALQASDPNEGLVNLFWDFLRDLLPQVDLTQKAKSAKGGSKSSKDVAAAKGKGKGKTTGLKEYGRPRDAVPEHERHLTISDRVRDLITARLDEEVPTIWDPYTYQAHVAGESNLDPHQTKLPFEAEEETEKLGPEVRTPEQLAMLEGLQGKYFVDETGMPGRIKQAEGRNPMTGSDDQPLALWEIKWQQRIKILRQLVDWMLVENPRVKEHINDLYPRQRKRPTVTEISVVPVMDKDSTNTRIWSIDDSYRLYASGNPNRIDCPISILAQDRAGYEGVIDRYRSKMHEIPQLTAIWTQASNKKRNSAKIQLDRVKLDVSIGKHLEAKIPAIEVRLAAIPEERAKRQEEKAKRARAVQQRAKQKLDMEDRLMAAQFGTGRETRSRTKVVNYSEAPDMEEEEEEEEEEEDPTVSYNNLKRHDSPSADEQYQETASESSSKRRKGDRSGLRSGHATEDGEDAGSHSEGYDGDEVSEGEEAQSMPSEDDDNASEETGTQDEDEEEASGTLQPSPPKIKLYVKPAPPKNRVMDSDDEEDKADSEAAEDANRTAKPGPTAESSNDEMDIDEAD